MASVDLCPGNFGGPPTLPEPDARSEPQKIRVPDHSPGTGDGVAGQRAPLRSPKGILRQRGVTAGEVPGRRRPRATLLSPFSPTTQVAKRQLGWHPGRTTTGKIPTVA